MPKPPPNPDQIFIGIDPGKSGGIAFLNSRRNVMTYSMPENESDIAATFFCGPNAQVFAVIEKVSASPQMGVTSAFTFGRGYGFLRGCLISMSIPFQEVTPQSWQRSLEIPSRKKSETQPQFKRRLMAIARQMFPSEKLTLKTADALLIAEYGRRFYHGK